MKVKVISFSYIFQVLYVLCVTRPRYQVSVYRTIGPLVSSCHLIFFQAYSYHGETLLAEEKCGEAIRGLQEGIKGKNKGNTVIFQKFHTSSKFCCNQDYKLNQMRNISVSQRNIPGPSCSKLTTLVNISLKFKT